MTLEEAIVKAEVVARREEYNYKTYTQIKPRNDLDKANCEYGAKSCLKSAEKHRQLAEWLKELKERREQDVPDTNVEDTISRQAAIDIVKFECGEWTGLAKTIQQQFDRLPSAQPEPSEITDEQAILHLQSTGWMQNHDREMYESGLREQLADDSVCYDSLIPCEDTIYRQAAVDALMEILDRPNHADFLYTDEICRALEQLPSAQPEIKPISYQDCTNAMMMMWMDNVLTDGEYRRIMDKLNDHEGRKENR